MRYLFFAISFLSFQFAYSQNVKILFDATKAETAGNADWVIDEDLNNMTWNPNATVGSGSEGNAQRVPTPAQSGITSSTTESFWKGALSSWGIECVKRGYYVETLPYNGSITYGNASNPQDLSNYQIYVITEPNILYTSAEKTAIIQFVKNGGGLFLIADHINSDRNNDGEDSPEILNDLMMNNSIQTNPFGFYFDSVSISPLSSNIPSLPSDSLLHGPMGDVTQVMWASGNTISIFPSINPSVKGIVYNTGASFGNKNVLVCYSRFGKGKIIAMGDSSPADDGTGDTGDNLYDGWITDAGGNHRKLIMNGTIWLATRDTVNSNTSYTDLSLDSIYSFTQIRGNNSLGLLLKNTGTKSIDSFNVIVTLNSNLTYQAKLNKQLLPGDTCSLMIPNAFVISKGGNYNLSVLVNTTNDTINSNDSIIKSFTIKYLLEAKINSSGTLNKPALKNNKIYFTLINTGEVAIKGIEASCEVEVTLPIREEQNNLMILPGDTFKFEYKFTFNLPGIDKYFYMLSGIKIKSDSDSSFLNNHFDSLIVDSSSLFIHDNSIKHKFSISKEEHLLKLFSLNYEIQSIQLFDMTGRNTASYYYNSTQTCIIETSELHGIYWMLVKTSDNNTAYIKIAFTD